MLKTLLECSVFRKVGISPLSWLLAINFFTFLFREDIGLSVSVFLIPTTVLLALELIHFCFKLASNQPAYIRRYNLKPKPFYKKLNGNDLLRMFASLAPATWLYSGSAYGGAIVLLVIIVLAAFFSIYVICADWFIERTVTPITIVGFVCLYVLYGWLLTLFISMYGSREFGHWLERQKYTVTVPVTVTICSQKYTCSGDGESAQAYIGVINESYLEDSGYDDDRSVSVDYREIWVLNFTTTASGEVHKITSGYLDDESSGWVEDDLGRRWLLSIKNYK